MQLSDITIVLPTRDEAHNIRAFIESIPAEVRLIMVDSSSDATPRIIARQRRKNSLILRRAASIAEARQIGAEAASTHWLLFTDADVKFAPDYFERLAVIEGDAGVVYGAKRSLGDFAIYYQWFVWGQRLFHWLRIPAATGSNLLIRRDAFKAAGGLDLALSCNEDSELVWRIQRACYPVEFDAGLVVYETDHRRLRRGIARKTGHALLRCAMLYLNLMPSRWRKSDWNYWAGLPDRGTLPTQDGSK